MWKWVECVLASLHTLCGCSGAIAERVNHRHFLVAGMIGKPLVLSLVGEAGGCLAPTGAPFKYM